VNAGVTFVFEGLELLVVLELLLCLVCLSVCLCLSVSSSVCYHLFSWQLIVVSVCVAHFLTSCVICLCENSD